ncbi:MAG: SDR family oxidoreductase [Gordonia sp. (in: high G+C Gram-positive bacteria)]
MNDHVLLTGASGLVGAEVAARLEAAGRPVVALTHRAAHLVGNDGRDVAVTASLAGDVRLPGFGVARIPDVGVIVHCAATTAFDAPAADYDELNVAGTAHAIEVARRLDVPLVHVSTAYVCGMRGGTVAETDLDVGQEFGNRYERSKFRAEQRVTAARRDGLRAVTVRPGIVAGESVDGGIRDHKNLYTVVKLMVEGKLRTLPGRYDATISLAPVDYVADVVTAATCQAADLDGQCFHAVGAHALTLRELSDVLAEYPSFAVATFVPATSFDAAALAPVEREYYRRVGSLYTSYFERRIHFDTTNAEALLGRPSPDCGADYLRLLLDHCLEIGYLGSPLPSVESVLARFGVV